MMRNAFPVFKLTNKLVIFRPTCENTGRFEMFENQPTPQSCGSTLHSSNYRVPSIACINGALKRKCVQQAFGSPASWVTRSTRVFHIFFFSFSTAPALVVLTYTAAVTQRMFCWEVFNDVTCLISFRVKGSGSESGRQLLAAIVFLGTGLLSQWWRGRATQSSAESGGLCRGSSVWVRERNGTCHLRDLCEYLHVFIFKSVSVCL